jgi:hypothetical protein
MKRIKLICKYLVNLFMNSRLSTKLILGYIIIVLFPTLALEALYYSQNVNWVYNEYILNEKSSLESSVNNFSQKVMQVEPLTDVFQANSNLLYYMEGSNVTEGEELYAYFKNINPVISYARSSIKIISNIQIFKFKKTYINLFSDILDMNRFTGDMGIIDLLGAREGKWVYRLEDSSGISATYYKSIYSKGYVNRLGFAEIKLKTENLFNTFDNLGEKLYLVFDGATRYCCMRTESSRPSMAMRMIQPPFCRYCEGDQNRDHSPRSSIRSIWNSSVSALSTCLAIQISFLIRELY